MGCTKMTKSDKFGDLNIYTYSDPHVLSFFCSQKYKVFKIDILHVCGINHWLHPEKNSNFFGTRKCDFLFF
jgi:hypothetical protein